MKQMLSDMKHIILPNIHVVLHLNAYFSQGSAVTDLMRRW